MLGIGHRSSVISWQLFAKHPRGASSLSTPEAQHRGRSEAEGTWGSYQKEIPKHKGH